VVVIEHNLDIIKSADRIIDMGPEGGEEGGMAIATGTPEEVAAEPASHTGQFLAELLTAAPASASAAAKKTRKRGGRLAAAA
jgi:excinuclease ABC subunit A